MALDRADWHSGGNYPADLPPENGGTHIGMFLTWAIMNGLQGEIHDEDSAEALKQVRARQMTGRDFLFLACDGKFWDEDLNVAGQAFAREYYSGADGKGYGPYIDDYERCLAGDLPSTYHVEDTWNNYDRISPIIDQRFAKWQAKHRK